MLIFTLSILPISINRLFEMSPRGWLTLSQAGKKFVEYAKTEIIQQIKISQYQKELLTLTDMVPLRLTIEFHSPNWITADGRIAVKALDNLPRAAQEALTAAIKTYNTEYSDTCIVEMVIKKKISEKIETVLLLEKM